MSYGLGLAEMTNLLRFYVTELLSSNSLWDPKGVVSVLEKNQLIPNSENTKTEVFLLKKEIDWMRFIRQGFQSPSNKLLQHC